MSRSSRSHGSILTSSPANSPARFGSGTSSTAGPVHLSKAARSSGMCSTRSPACAGARKPDSTGVIRDRRPPASPNCGWRVLWSKLAMALSELTLPHWDMTVLYPGLDSPEFRTGFQAFADDITALEQLFDTHRIAKHSPVPMDDETVAAFDIVINQLNSVIAAATTMWSYVASFL